MQQRFTSVPNQFEIKEAQDMREIISTVSSKGQITIPAEVRKHLGIREGDKLSFVIEDEGSVKVEAPRYHNVASLRGAAGKLDKPLSWEGMLAVAREDHVREVTNNNVKAEADANTK